MASPCSPSSTASFPRTPPPTPGPHDPLPVVSAARNGACPGRSRRIDPLVMRPTYRLCSKSGDQLMRCKYLLLSANTRHLGRSSASQNDSSSADAAEQVVQGHE